MKHSLEFGPRWPHQCRRRRYRRLYLEAGFEVVAVHDLQRRDRAAVAAVTANELLAGLRAIDSEEIDAIVQVGTNLPCAEHRALIEAEITAPVLAINEVALWHALRGVGDHSTAADHGPLLRGH